MARVRFARLVVAVAGSALLEAGCGARPAQFAAPAETLIRSETAPDSGPVVAPPPPDDRVAVVGEVVVRFQEGTYEVDRPPELPGAEAVRPVEGIPGAWVYRMKEGRYTTAAADALRADPRLAYAEPNYRYHILEVAEEADEASHATYNPPGEDLGPLWGIRKIQAPEAWDRTRGKASVLVAVIDTGVDYRHDDLAGFVVKGPDLVNRDGDPMDDHGHGTHVAGTIAARANGTGVVGVAYGVKVLAIKALDEDGSGPEDQIARAIDAAIQNGARVINMSLGGPDDSRALRDAVARAHRKGVLCVVAAGNDGNTRNGYPAAYPDAFAVGATDTADRRTYFSNYGRYVQIAAPGAGILSSAAGGGYERLSGTSMAAPHVAGAAGLLLSARPDLGPTELKRLLAESGDPVSGFTETPGVRRLNVFKALQRVGDVGPGNPDPGPGDEDPDRGTGISAIAVTRRHTDGATIRWKTDAPTLGFVEFGPTPEYGATTFYEEGFATDHEITISGLKRWKWYHFRVHAQTQDGRKFVSTDHKFLTKLWWLFSLEGDPVQAP